MDVTHRGRDNVYIFYKNDRKIVLSPVKEGNVPKAFKAEGKPFILLVNNEDDFNKDAGESERIFSMVLTDEAPKTAIEIPATMSPLIKSFRELFPEDLLTGLPPMRDIQQCIDLVARASFSNLPHYRMSLK